jgi:hypothetical protein
MLVFCGGIPISAQTFLRHSYSYTQDVGIPALGRLRLVYDLLCNFHWTARLSGDSDDAVGEESVRLDEWCAASSQLKHTPAVAVACQLPRAV